MAVIDNALMDWDGDTTLANSVSTNGVSGAVSASLITDLGASGKTGWSKYSASLTAVNRLGGDLRFNVNVQTASISASGVMMVELCTHSATASFHTNAKAIAAVAIEYDASSTSHLGYRGSVSVPTVLLDRYVAPRVRAIGAKVNSGTLDVWLGFGEDPGEELL